MLERPGTDPMKRQHTLQILMASCLASAAFATRAGVPVRAESALMPSYPVGNRAATAQVPFIRNQGQIPNAEVEFYSRTFAGTLFVTAESHLVYALPT